MILNEIHHLTILLFVYYIIPFYLYLIIDLLCLMDLIYLFNELIIVEVRDYILMI